MFRFTILLRCLLIVAFCLDGSAALWSASSMAVSMAGHDHAPIADERVHHDSASIAAEEDCQESAPVAREDSSHQDCDCNSAECRCPAGFTNVAFAHAVPFLAQHRVSATLTLPESASVVRSSLSPVFRPPIG